MESQRIHFDAMRAILMLLGVYFHLSLAYVTFGDGSENKIPILLVRFLTLVFAALHYFRMHGFFMIAGFFGSLLYHKRGAKKMMSNRFKRILLPPFCDDSAYKSIDYLFGIFHFKEMKGFLYGSLYQDFLDF